MEGIALTTEFIGSVIAYLGGVALLAFVVSVVLLGYMADEEASGNRIFRAESPFTDVGEAPVESVKYLRITAMCALSLRYLNGDIQRFYQGFDADAVPLRRRLDRRPAVTPRYGFTPPSGHNVWVAEMTVISNAALAQGNLCLTVSN